MNTIKFTPTEGLSYNPNEDKYWDEIALRKEIDRTFEICHSCRMCFKYCDTFPAIFDLIDKENLEVKIFQKKIFRQSPIYVFSVKSAISNVRIPKRMNTNSIWTFPV